MTDNTPKFTPGPWRICDDGGTVNYRELVIRDRPPINGIKQLPVDICCCTGCLNTACEREANAALIAQSPAMYDELNGASVFLRTLAEVLEVTFQHDSRKEYAENALRLAKGMKERADRIDALLAKARGYYAARKAAKEAAR